VPYVNGIVDNSDSVQEEPSVEATVVIPLSAAAALFSSYAFSMCLGPLNLLYSVFDLQSATETSNVDGPEDNNDSDEEDEEEEEEKTSSAKKLWRFLIT
jgi:hypothetical protein